MNASRAARRRRARYLIGEAVMRHLKSDRARPERAAEVAAIAAVLTLQLSDDEADAVMFGTGWDFSGILGLEPEDVDIDQGVLDFPPPGGFLDEEIPF